MSAATDEAFERFCEDTGVKYHQKPLVRHGWVAAINYKEAQPETAGRTLAGVAPTTAAAAECSDAEDEAYREDAFR